jgi:hypothetical protein
MEQLLRKGSRGPYVIWVREALQYCGMTERFAYDYTFDGDMDVLVRKYQDFKGLAADGIVGPLTWAAMEAECEGKDRVWMPTELLEPDVRGYREASIIHDRVFHWCMARGYHDPWIDTLAAGIIASAYTESRLDAAAVNPKSSATGLFQVMSHFWGLRPTKEERLDPWRNTDLILWGLSSISATHRRAILRAAQLERRPIENTMVLFCRHVEAANDRNTEMEWRRRLCRELFKEE